MGDTGYPEAVFPFRSKSLTKSSVTRRRPSVYCVRMEKLKIDPLKLIRFKKKAVLCVLHIFKYFIL